ncbi:MAG: alpha/beta hydrolase [Deltaproteobacteria bacterium]|nr:alpha/beta hydrolase [Deltaproteobacteria bacterium]
MLRIALITFAALAAGCASSPRTPTHDVDPATIDRIVAGPVSLRYRDTGGDRPPLVLVHGNFDRLETWARVVPLLAPHFRVVTLDLPGFGESRNPTGRWDYGSLALGVRLVMDDARIERATLVGNSLGGGVVATFATLFPERVAGLGLEDTNLLRAGTTYPSGDLMAKLGPLFQAADKLAKSPEDEAARAALRDATGAAVRVALVAPGAVDDALVEHYARGFEGARLDAVKGVNAASTASLERLARDLEEAIEGRDVPLAILWGLDDPFLPVENADLIKARFPAARLVLFDGCGHAPHLERPAELAAALVETFGPSAARADAYVASPHEPLAYPGGFNELPFVDRAIRRTLVAGGNQAGELPWLALNQLAAGAFDEALATVAALPADWGPEHRAWADYVAGAVHEVQGDVAAAVASYLKAVQVMVPEARQRPLLRLARLPLDEAQAAIVDGLLGAPLGDSEPTMLLIARVDRLLAREQWQDALALLDRYTIKVPLTEGITLRRAIAERGASRPPTDPGRAASDSILSTTSHRLDSARERAALLAIGRCRARIAGEREMIDGLGGPPYLKCTPLGVGRLDFTLAPPPAIVAWAESKTAYGAVLRARAALSEGRDADARAELEAVPAERASQTPELHRLRLALRAATDRRGAVAEARRLVAAHDRGPAWRRALATTLAAAGELRKARDELVALTLLGPTASLREELAYVEAAMGHEGEARALLDALRAQKSDWQGSPTRHLPHLRAHAARLWAPKP